MLFSQPKRIALILLGLLAPLACAPPPQVPREDDRLSEEQMVLLAARQILEEEGYPVVSSTPDATRLTTAWVESQDAMRQNVTISVQLSSNRVTLNTRVLVAVPEEKMLGVQPEGKENAPIQVHGRHYWIDHSRQDLAQSEETRLGKLIQARWKSIQRDVTR